MQAEMPAAKLTEAMEQHILEARQAVVAGREAVTLAEAQREETQKTEATLREIYQSARTVTERLAAEERADNKLPSRPSARTASNNALAARTPGSYRFMKPMA